MSVTAGYGRRRCPLGATTDSSGGSQSMCSKLAITHKATRAWSGQRSGARVLIGDQS
jgi:hypothetical protein